MTPNNPSGKTDSTLKLYTKATEHTQDVSNTTADMQYTISAMPVEVLSTIYHLLDLKSSLRLATCTKHLLSCYFSSPTTAISTRENETIQGQPSLIVTAYLSKNKPILDDRICCTADLIQHTPITFAKSYLQSNADRANNLSAEQVQFLCDHVPKIMDYLPASRLIRLQQELEPMTYRQVLKSIIYQDTDRFGLIKTIKRLRQESNAFKKAFPIKTMQTLLKDFRAAKQACHPSNIEVIFENNSNEKKQWYDNEFMSDALLMRYLQNSLENSRSKNPRYVARVLFDKASDALKNDARIVSRAMKNEHLALSTGWPPKENKAILSTTSDRLRDNELFMRFAISIEPGNVSFASSRLRSEKSILLEYFKALKSDNSIVRLGHYNFTPKIVNFTLFAPEFHHSFDLMSLAIEASRGRHFKDASATLRANPTLVKKAIDLLGDNYYEIPKHFREKREMVLAAITSSGSPQWKVLADAPQHFSSDINLTLEAIKQLSNKNSKNYFENMKKYWPSILKNKANLIRVLTLYPEVIKALPKTSVEDYRYLILEVAPTQPKIILSSASYLKTDNTFLKKLILKNPDTLQYINFHYLDTKDLLPALKKHKKALKHVLNSDSLSPAIAWAIINWTKGKAITQIPEYTLKAGRLPLLVLKRYPDCYHMLPDSIKALPSIREYQQNKASHSEADQFTLRRFNQFKKRGREIQNDDAQQERAKPTNHSEDRLTPAQIDRLKSMYQSRKRQRL